MSPPGGPALELDSLDVSYRVRGTDRRVLRIQGVVRFDVLIGTDGHIVNMQLVNGHPLLVSAAQEAVRQWVYQPTLLNEQPVEVQTQMDVNFTLQ